MNFWIVGIDHELQLTRAETDSASLLAQKDQLEFLLKEGLGRRQIGFISEESKLRKLTIAGELASANIPRIPWINIIMTHDRSRTRVRWNRRRFEEASARTS